SASSTLRWVASLAGRTKQHKTALDRPCGGRPGPAAAELCRSFCSRDLPSRQMLRTSKHPTGAGQMSNYDAVDGNQHPWLGRLIVVGVFLLAQGVAMLLVAFIALLVSLEPGWSATTEQASLLQPGDAKSGSLLLKEDGAYTEAIRLGIDVDITVSGPTLRARVTQVFRNPTKDWVEATYVYPLPTG